MKWELLKRVVKENDCGVSIVRSSSMFTVALYEFLLFISTCLHYCWGMHHIGFKPACTCIVEFVPCTLSLLQRSQFLLPFCYLAFHLCCQNNPDEALKNEIYCLYQTFRLSSTKYDEGLVMFFLCRRELLDEFS